MRSTLAIEREARFRTRSSLQGRTHSTRVDAPAQTHTLGEADAVVDSLGRRSRLARKTASRAPAGKPPAQGSYVARVEQRVSANGKCLGCDRAQSGTAS